MHVLIDCSLPVVMETCMEVIRRLRYQKCICVNRTVKRRLKYFGIFVDHISVKSSDRVIRRNGRPVSFNGANVRNLITCPIQRRCQGRIGKYNRLSVPSLLLTNVRSVFNKMDELELRFSQYQV